MVQNPDESGGDTDPPSAAGAVVDVDLFLATRSAVADEPALRLEIGRIDRHEANHGTDQPAPGGAGAGADAGFRR